MRLSPLLLPVVAVALRIDSRASLRRSAVAAALRIDSRASLRRIAIDRTTAAAALFVGAPALAASDSGAPPIDWAVIGGSALWGINLNNGLDWLLAPVGLDSDFTPGERVTVALGRLQAGRSLQAAAAPVVDNGGERPELGTRLGAGANLGYTVSVDDDENAAAAAPTDWLTDREAGLRADAPLPLRLGVSLGFLMLGAVVQAIFGAGDPTIAAQTGAVLAFAGGVYEIGRPAPPTRAEAVADARLDAAFEEFAKARLLQAGDATEEGVTPVRSDETVNEREVLRAFRVAFPRYSTAEGAADTQIEMRVRGFTRGGRSNAGFLRGLRLLDA